MEKRKILWGMLVLVLGMAFAGCDNNPEDKPEPDPVSLIGTWSNSDGVVVVVTATTWSATIPGQSPMNGTYTSSGNTHSLSMAGQGVVGTAAQSGNTLVVVLDGESVTLTKS